MDNTLFPKELGGYIADKTFLQVFEGCPKITEFVDTLWLEDKTTGLFKEFFVYIKNQLAVPHLKGEHETRCYNFVKNSKVKDLPSYMRKYLTDGCINTI